MSYGLFGTLTRESDTSLVTGAESTVEDDVMADAAFMEAAELTQESEQLAGYMAQSMNVADRLERQDSLCGELLQHPEQITAGVAAMTRESMDLAMAALGGTNKEYRPDDASLISAPVNALEVTHEGIGSTTKKIYEAIKMAFKKIWLNIKKLAAKVVVFMNNTGKKAEKLHKALKANKVSMPKESKMDSSKAAKMLESFGGISRIDGNTSKDRLDVLAKNIDLVSKMDDKVDADFTTLEAEMLKGLKDLNLGDGVAPTSEQEVTLLSNALVSGNYSSAAYATAANVVTSPDKLNSSSEVLVFPSGVTTLEVAQDELVVDDEYVGKVQFVPFYAKGNKLYGAAYYFKKLDDDATPRDLLGASKYKFVSVEGRTSDEVSSESEKFAIMNKANIINALIDLKGASKRLKSFSDSRLKHVEKLMKIVDTAAKAATGLTFLNRMRGTELNKRQMFSANVDISSIFAAANVYKTELKSLVIFMSYYEE